MNIERYSKDVAKEVLQIVTLPLAKRVPIESQPGLLGRIHNFGVPKNTRMKAEHGPGGGANVKIIFHLLDCVVALEGAIAECGVWQGGTVIPIGLFLRQHGSQKKIFGFHSFEEPCHSPRIEAELNREKGDRSAEDSFVSTSFAKLAGRIQRLGLADTVQLVAGQNDALKQHANERFCFVHLDCATYESYKSYIEFFYPRLVTGGIILLDEYNDPPWPGCARAIDEFLADKPEPLLEITSDNQTKYYLRKR